MPNITFLTPDGESLTFAAASGTSVMQVAVSNGVDGIVAECGGSAMCATCHVYVEPGSLAGLPAPDAVEDEMLNATAAERRCNSRLSCQLTVGDEDLVVRLPEMQV
jgi:ferredoxin, 2Fe-2S